MNALLIWIQEHAGANAPYVLFGLALLAGVSLPISIDLLMIVGATLAATVIPEYFYSLFFALFIGCVFSAWIAYALGRFIGDKLRFLPFFCKLLSEKRLMRIKNFYGKRGPFAFIIGRFIPFGIRNVLYMSSGMSRHPFLKFAFWDSLACLIWSLFSFSLYFLLGKNIEMLYGSVKSVNLVIFAAFSVTVIGVICYKKREKAKEEDV